MNNVAGYSHYKCFFDNRSRLFSVDDAQNRAFLCQTRMICERTFTEHGSITLYDIMSIMGLYFSKPNEFYVGNSYMPVIPSDMIIFDDDLDIRFTHNNNEEWYEVDIIGKTTLNSNYICLEAAKKATDNHREKILKDAIKCVCGQREQDYGTPEDTFGRIADLWSAYLKKDISTVDVSMMMALMKIARIQNGGTEDSFVDLAGYAACGGEIYMNNKEVSDNE